MDGIIWVFLFSLSVLSPVNDFMFSHISVTFAMYSPHLFTRKETVSVLLLLKHNPGNRENIFCEELHIYYVTTTAPRTSMDGPDVHPTTSNWISKTYMLQNKLQKKCEAQLHHLIEAIAASPRICQWNYSVVCICSLCRRTANVSSYMRSRVWQRVMVARTITGLIYFVPDLLLDQYKISYFNAKPKVG